jgi:hypothetical protein
MDIAVSYDASKPWYHGSPLRLDVLRVGSTVTQWRDLARVFSHKPPVVCIEDAGTLRHNGTLRGYLYEVAETVVDRDVQPHPRTTMGPGDEWLTQRELRLRLIEQTEVQARELLTDGDILALRRAHQA